MANKETCSKCFYYKEKESKCEYFNGGIGQRDPKKDKCGFFKERMKKKAKDLLDEIEGTGLLSSLLREDDGEKAWERSRDIITTTEASETPKKKDFITETFRKLKDIVGL